MILLGFVNWGIQEMVAPKTNKIQDELRVQIRSRGVTAKKEGKYWVANDQRIFSFEMEESKNEVARKVKNLSIYEFSEDQSKLQTIYRTTEAVWEKDKIKFSNESEKQVWKDGKFEITQISNNEINEKINPFKDLYEKPSHLNVKEIKEQISKSESETEQKNFKVALEKKYTTMFLPFVITLFTAPFALSISRKGRVVTIGYAVGVWLLFMAVTNTFEQFGLNGYITARFAVWSPLFLFSIIGAFLLSKVRT
jgi:lipopolysaccharide export LptBFGC system permease protein LptF